MTGMNSVASIPAPDANVVVKPCRHGTFCYFPHDRFIGRSLDAYGEYVEQEAALFAQLLRPGHTVVEVGSNIGAHTVPLARMVGNSGRVYAFEPQRIIFQQLCANVALNGLLNVHAYQNAVGEWSGTIGVPPVDYTSEGNFGGVEMSQHGEPEMVPMLRLDDTPFAPDFIKIDCEGMELDVLKGASSTINAHRPVLYMENDREDKSQALLTYLLDDLKYDAWWHLPRLYSPDNWRGNPQNLWPGIVSGNCLAIPAEHKLSVTNLRKVSGPDDRCW